MIGPTIITFVPTPEELATTRNRKIDILMEDRHADPGGAPGLKFYGGVRPKFGREPIYIENFPPKDPFS